jgi:hypothetical protein
MTDAEYQEGITRISQQIEKSRAELASQQAAMQEANWWSTTSAMTMSAAVLVFGLLICCLAAYLIRKERPADVVLRTLGTLLIIVAAIFLVVAGYSDKQMAPVFGLLGTIAGYLLGKGTGESKGG